MSGPTLVVFVGGLIAVLLLIVAALMWQEARARTFDDGPVYVIEDAVDFVTDSLTAEVGARLDRSDVLRILEWEIFYLQGLAQPDRRQPVETIAGADEAALAYIVGEIAQHNKVLYDSHDVAAVLEVEAEYLASIGAIGERVVDQRGREPS